MDEHQPIDRRPPEHGNQPAQHSKRRRVSTPSGTSPFAIIADFEHSWGEVNVSGNGSTWNTSELWVGNYGAGDLNVFNDGDVTSTVGRIGVQSTSNGTVRVGGTGSTWHVTATFRRRRRQWIALSSSGGAVYTPLGVCSRGRWRCTRQRLARCQQCCEQRRCLPRTGRHPGLSASTLNINGNYIQSSIGTLHIDLDTGDHGRLARQRRRYAGRYDRRRLDHRWPFWQPSPGQSFTLLSWTGTRSGTFTTVNLPDPNLGIAWIVAVCLKRGAASRGHVRGSPAISTVTAKSTPPITSLAEERIGQRRAAQ